MFVSHTSGEAEASAEADPDPDPGVREMKQKWDNLLSSFGRKRVTTPRARQVSKTTAAKLKSKKELTTKLQLRKELKTMKMNDGPAKEKSSPKKGSARGARHSRQFMQLKHAMEMPPNFSHPAGISIPAGNVSPMKNSRKGRPSIMKKSGLRHGKPQGQGSMSKQKSMRNKLIPPPPGLAAQSMLSKRKIKTKKLKLRRPLSPSKGNRPPPKSPKKPPPPKKLPPPPPQGSRREEKTRKPAHLKHKSGEMTHQGHPADERLFSRRPPRPARSHKRPPAKRPPPPPPKREVTNQGGYKPPPKRPQGGYRPPKRPQGGYAPPKKPQGGYSPPKKRPSYR